MRLQTIWYTFASGCLIAAAFLGGAWLYRHWNDADIEIVVVNFAVSCIPFLLTILIWFVPDPKKVHIAWRVAVTVLGVFFSFLVFKQQVLMLRVSKADQAQAVMTAVSDSDGHTDQEIGKVKNQLQESTSTLKGRLDKLSGLVSKSESDLNGSISKVGVPVSKYAQLQFSLWTDIGNMAQTPLLVETVTPGLDGVLSVDFTVSNISDTAATSADLWVRLCDQCSFAKEPQGFDRPTGMNERTRHRQFMQLNPGVSLEKMTVDMKTTGSFSLVLIGFRYSCMTCGAATPMQTLKVFTNQGVPQTLLPQLPNP